MDNDSAARIDRDPIVRVRQIFGHHPPIDASLGEGSQQRPRDPPLVCRKHSGLELPEQLQVPERVGMVPFAVQVKIIHRHCLLEHRRVFPKWINRHKRRVVVHHIIAADQSGPVGQTIWMSAVSGAKQNCCRIRGATRQDKGLGSHLNRLPILLYFSEDDGLTGRIGG
jgi:hypothetical protein